MPKIIISPSWTKNTRYGGGGTDSGFYGQGKQPKPVTTYPLEAKTYTMKSSGGGLLRGGPEMKSMGSGLGMKTPKKAPKPRKV